LTHGAWTGCLWPAGQARVVLDGDNGGDVVSPLPGNLETDVVVVGGGITGITTAFLLKQAGYAVAVIEAGRICRGVTGHTTAKVTSLHRLIYAELIDRFGSRQAQQYAEANQAAIETVASVVREYDIPCSFERKPAYTYAESEESRNLVAAEADAARSLGLPATFVEEVPLPGRTYGAVVVENQAQFHPLKYLLHLASLIPGDGSQIFEKTRAIEVQDGGGRCTPGAVPPEELPPAPRRAPPGRGELRL